MKFEDALPLAVADCESCGTDDAFYLYCILSDYVGADFAGKDAVKMLYEIDRRIQVVKNILRSGKAACIISKAAYPAFKSQYSPKRFRDFLDDVYCILTHTPRGERQSGRVCAKIVKNQYSGGQIKKGKTHASAPAPVPNVYAQIPPYVPPKFRGLWLLRQAIRKK